MGEWYDVVTTALLIMMEILKQCKHLNTRDLFNYDISTQIGLLCSHPKELFTESQIGIPIMRTSILPKLI